MDMDQNKGLLFVLVTALVSGTAIFVNKFAVADMSPFIFAAMKNILVAVFLFSLILLFRDFGKLKSLGRKNWLKLAAIGLVGGSIPFLIFFYALNLTSALNAGFLHKTMFIFVAVMALFLLREKISKKFIAGALLLLGANFMLFSGVSGFGLPDLLILIAVLFWAGENILSKHTLKELSGRQVAFGRMFFGSLFMLVFLIFSGQFSLIFELGTEQIGWVLLTSGFLFLYVLFWYSGIKHIEVSKAACVLLLGQPVTALLSFVFLGSGITLMQGAAFLLMLIGVVLVVGISQFRALLELPFVQLAKNKN